MTESKSELNLPSDVRIVSANLVDKKDLDIFFKKAYPQRSDFLSAHFNWLYRNGFTDSVQPQFLKEHNHLAGQAGGVAVLIQTGDRIRKGAWYTDIVLFDGYLGKGYGMLLTENFMQMQELALAFGNDKSLGILIKKGWSESNQTFMHSFIAQAFLHPRIKRFIPAMAGKFLSFIFSPLMKLFFGKNGLESWKMEAVNESSLQNFIALYANREITQKDGATYRDDAYFKWRILDSPFVHSYRIITANNFSAIICLQKRSDAGFIDILCVSDSSRKNEIAKLICTLRHYACSHNLSHIRYFTSKKDVSKFISTSRLSSVKHPRFAYFASDKKVQDELKNVHWDVQMIDSDFEFID